MNINNRWFQLCASRNRDGHDCEPAVRVDAVRATAAAGHRLEAVGDPIRVRAVHPVPDMGAAARRLADRPHGSALVHQRRRLAVRARLGRAWVTPRRSRCSTPCTARQASARRSSTAVRIGSALKWFKERRGLASGIMAGGIRRRHGALHPVHFGGRSRTAAIKRHSSATGIFQGLVIVHRRAVPAASGAASVATALAGGSRAADVARSSRRCEMLQDDRSST